MPKGHLPVRSYLAVPVTSQSGEVLGGLFFGHHARGVFTERAERLAAGIAAQAAIAMDNARLYQQVQQALRTRDEFLAAAAHDLKTPIASTKGIAQLLRRRINRMDIPNPERLTEGLERIDQGVQRMTGLIDELLDLARLQMDRPLDLDRERMDLAALLRQAVLDLQPNAPRHTFKVVVPDGGLVGAWDANRIRRVMDNLVSNAVKYSPDGGEVVVRAEEARDDRGRTALVEVTDHGVGIPAADLPYIFERFRRGGNVTFIHGTGIGLGIAQSIVEQHGGSIGVESIEGKGSTFTVRLPLD
jgi:signal transduction histidine kinase